jgi:hypothetical protein
MTAEQKEVYNNKAKGMPKGQKKVEVEKYDTRGNVSTVVFNFLFYFSC